MNVAESTEFHSRILRVTLSVEESAVFWERAPVAATAIELNPRAFEERWYGGKSHERVKKLHEDFFDRYSFPGAREALKVWSERSMPPEARRLCAHWHLQLVDPLYRAFTGEWLVARRALGHADVSRDAVMPWVNEVAGADYAAATRQMFAGKLLTAAAQAGLVGSGTSRALPPVGCSLDALGYLLYLLRSVSFAGSALDNVYLRSVGMTGERLAGRLAEGERAGWWHVREEEIDWTWSDLPAWAKATR